MRYREETVPQIEKLRYVRLGVKDTVAAAEFARRIVGLQQIEAPDGLAMFRSDSRDHSLVIAGADEDGESEALAIQLRTSEDLDTVCDRLQEAGYEVVRGSAEECAERRCKQMAHFRVRDAVRIELVVRPLDSGWRYFGSRDAGITGFFGVAFASTDVAADTKLWTQILGGKIADYLGDAVYIAIDDEHHRIALHPSTRDGILEVQYQVEGLHQLMQNSYYLQSAQVPIVHGPGRRPASEQLFLTFKGPCGSHFGFVAEGMRRAFDEPHAPRQFGRTAESFCGWGSHATIPEYSA